MWLCSDDDDYDDDDDEDDDALAPVSCTCSSPHLPKSAPIPSLCCFFWNRTPATVPCAKKPTSSSKSAPSMTAFRFFAWHWILATVSCAFWGLHLPKVFRTLQFFKHVQVEIQLLLPSRAHFADLVFQKISDPFSFLHVEVGIELLLQSCANFVDNFPRSRRATAETETFLRRPRKPLYRKKPQGFASESLLKPEFTRPWPFPTNYLMMWLSWWWESSPWQSSVARKFSN